MATKKAKTVKKVIIKGQRQKLVLMLLVGLIIGVVGTKLYEYSRAAPGAPSGGYTYNYGNPEAGLTYSDGSTNLGKTTDQCAATPGGAICHHNGRIEYVTLQKAGKQAFWESTSTSNYASFGPYVASDVTGRPFQVCWTLGIQEDVSFHVDVVYGYGTGPMETAYSSDPTANIGSSGRMDVIDICSNYVTLPPNVKAEYRVKTTSGQILVGPIRVQPLVGPFIPTVPGQNYNMKTIDTGTIVR